MAVIDHLSGSYSSQAASMPVIGVARLVARVQFYYTSVFFTNHLFRCAFVTPQVKMMDDYLEFRPKEGGDDAVVGVSRRDMLCVPLAGDFT